MKSATTHKTSAVIKQNIFYYDEIALKYDNIMDQDKSNEIIRQKVTKKFRETVQSGLVLDFGGGTGKDLLWLTEKGYRVIFCEPSSKMKEKAIDLIKKNVLEKNIFILPEEKTDFAKWSHNLPFLEKMDAVLCNFAVINCIPDIKSFFRNLAIIMKPEANLIALILDNNFKKMMRQSWRKTIAATMFGFPYRISVHSGQYRQTVYIHTDKRIKKISKKYFEFKSNENLSQSGFCLIHLIRK